jgi:predicted small lipoprotein YifL
MTNFNKNNKRIIALIAAMSLCFSVLSGCGSKQDYDTEVPPSDANEEVTEVAEAEDTSEEVSKDTEAEEPETENLRLKKLS